MVIMNHAFFDENITILKLDNDTRVCFNQYIHLKGRVKT